MPENDRDERIRKLLKDLDDTTRHAHQLAHEVRTALRKDRAHGGGAHSSAAAKSTGSPRRKKG